MQKTLAHTHKHAKPRLSYEPCWVPLRMPAPPLQIQHGPYHMCGSAQGRYESSRNRIEVRQPRIIISCSPNLARPTVVLQFPLRRLRRDRGDTPGPAFPVVLFLAMYVSFLHGDIKEITHFRLNLCLQDIYKAQLQGFCEQETMVEQNGGHPPTPQPHSSAVLTHVLAGCQVTSSPITQAPLSSPNKLIWFIHK